MIQQAFDRHDLQQYVAAIRDSLDAPGMQDSVAAAAAAVYGRAVSDPVTQLRDRMPDVEPELASSGGQATDAVPYLSRDPIQSLLQSTLESKLRAQGVSTEAPEHHGLLSEIAHTIESLLHPTRFGPDDPDWVLDVGKSMLDRLAQGNHDFNPEPATHEIADDAILIVVGDWGTGLPRAKAVAGFMAEEVGAALAANREVHVVHLGDVYYSGTDEEVQRHVLADGLWPVTLEQAQAGVSSWSLSGNHDMYGGGFGYFDHLLADDRFACQRSPDAETTSFFRIRSPSWDLVGLDTSWDTDVLSTGQVGVLADPQAKLVADVASESSRKLMLLSHHQPVSVYDTGDLGPTLTAKLGPTLGSGRVAAWLWGHEHRCMGFKPDLGVPFLRCIGHGGVPVLMDHSGPVPSPGIWEQREFLTADGQNWARFGFAVLDFHGDQVAVRYRNDTGATVPPSEQIP
jgi:hypothetical protein